MMESNQSRYVPLDVLRTVACTYFSATFRRLPRSGDEERSLVAALCRDDNETPRRFLRRAALTAMLLGLAVAVSAAKDPFVGTWKMNRAKSKYTVGTLPQEQVATISVHRHDMNVKVAAITTEGKKTVVHYSIPYDGGMGKMSETTPAYDGILGRHIGPNEREISRLKDGKVVFTARSVVSGDGKSMATFSKGVSPTGKPVEAHLVYDKVK